MPHLQEADPGLENAASLPAGAGAAPALNEAAPIEWLEAVVTGIPPDQAMARLEHFLGVMPLVRRFFGQEGERPELASLGLFTPNPQFDWRAAAVRGELAEGGATVSGRVRVPRSDSVASIVLVRLAEDDCRLAWVGHGEGVTVLAGSPSWWALEDVRVAGGDLSEPVDPGRHGDLERHLDAYAGFYAFAASRYAFRGIRALRRAARTTEHQGTPFSTSQLVTMNITGVEIEVDLATAAVRRNLELGSEDDSRASGLVLAAAASKALNDVIALTAELRDQAALRVDGPLAGPETSRNALCAFLGGPLMLESELARSLEI